MVEPERSSFSSRCHEGVVVICERSWRLKREEVWRARESQVQVGEGKKGRKGRPPEYYQVRVEGNKVLWRGMTLTHIKDLPEEERNDVLNKIRRLKEQGFGWIKIQKIIARSCSVYVPYKIIKKAITNEEINWTRSGVRGPHIDLVIRKKMYKRVMELHSQRKNYGQIREAIRKEFGINLSMGTISFWCRGIHRPGGKEIELTPDTWWLLGFLHADGSIDVRYYDNYCVRRIILRVHDRVLIEKVAKLTGNSIMMDKRDGGLSIFIHRRELFDLIQNVKRAINERRFDELLETMGEDGVKQFIRGFFDGDGSGLFVNFINNDLNTFEFIRYALKRVCGIETSEPVLMVKKGTMTYNPARKQRVVTRKDIYIVFVYPDHYQRFEEVGTTLERKIHLWKLSEKILQQHSTKYGRTYFEEIKRRYEAGEDWTDVLMYLLKSVGASMRKKQKKTPTPSFSPLLN